MEKIFTNYKRTVFITVMLLAVSLAYGQNALYRSGFGGNIGLSNYDGDYGRNYFNLIEKGQMGLFSLHKYVSPRFNVTVAGSVGDVRAFDDDKQEFDFSVKALDMMLAFKILSEEAKLSPYLFAGVGVLNHEIGRTANTVNVVNFPMGGGMRYGLSPQFALDLNFKQNFPLSEELDGRISGGHHDDFIQYSMGLVYNFNKIRDDDEDGVADKYDSCPDTKPGLNVDVWGCSVDNDRDGVINEVDECPELAGTKKLRGCPDSDNDGVTDAEDKCPEQNGSKYASGCPDIDNDSVIDAEDKCPDSPGSAELAGCPDSDNDGIIDEEDRCPLSPGLPENKGCPKRKTN